MLELQPITCKEANAFIKRHHRHLIMKPLQPPNSDFVLDLYNLLPDLGPELAPLEEIGLYAPGKPLDGDTFQALSCWNGAGCLVFTEEPPVQHLDGGYISIEGYMTRDRVLLISLPALVRYAWSQQYPFTLNGVCKIAFSPPRGVRFDSLHYHMLREGNPALAKATEAPVLDCIECIKANIYRDAVSISEYLAHIAQPGGRRYLNNH